jgi:hypothetical protein
MTAFLKRKMDEAYAEYLRCKMAHDNYLGETPDPEEEEESSKPDIKAKNIWRDVLSSGAHLTDEQMFEALVAGGWSTTYPERAFQRALTTNRKAGNIIRDHGSGKWRKTTDSEKDRGLKQYREEFQRSRQSPKKLPRKR